MENEEYLDIKEGLSVGTMKIANKYEIFTEEEIDAINNKIPELDERVDVIKDEIDEINSSLDNMESEKATKTEIDVERKRIDNIIAQPPTVDNVETTDIRVGADGVIYSSAGNSVRSQITDVNNSIADLTLLPSFFNFTKKGLLDNLTFDEGKSINISNSSSMNINNYREHMVDSAYGNVSNVLRIKLDNGTPIFKNWNWHDIDSTAVFIHYFDKNGNYSSNRNMHSTYVNDIPSNAYYCLIIKYSNLPLMNSTIDSVDVEWLNETIKTQLEATKTQLETNTDNINRLMETIDTGKVYIVGKSKNSNYQSLTECLLTLKDDTSKKTIYVEDGIYNIFEEIGGSTFAKSITDTQHWSDVSVFIPDNTSIIGIGNVVLNFLPEKDETTAIASTRLSPINIRGNVHLENLKIYAKNCRYCIHDEVGTDELYFNKTHEFINVECYYLRSDYNAGAGGQAYANGFQSGMKYIFKNCIFDGKARNPAFTMHNNNDNAPFSSTIIIDNCIFNPPSNQPSIAFYNSVIKQMNNDVKISNSFLNGRLQLGKNWTGTSMKNAFNITMNNCNEVVVEDLLENNIFTPKIYNIIK